MSRRTALLLAALALAVRLAAAVIFDAETGDIPGYRTMANVVLAGDNIYHHRVLFPYTPLTLPLPALSLLLAQASGLSFAVAIKLWPIAADVALTLLVAAAVARRTGRPAAARAAGLAYALNPVAILTSAFHGNQTTLAVAFAVAAYVATLRGPAGSRLAAVLLGLGIAARSFPVLLLPVFLIALPTNPGRAAWRGRATFAAWTLLPVALVSLPALLADAPAYLREIFSYSGFVDQGWLAIRRAWGVVWGLGGPEPVPTAATLALLQASKWLVLAAYAALLVWLARRRPPVDLAVGCLPAWLLFLVVYGGVSTHYLVWVVPFGLIAAGRWAVAYSLAAAAAMIGFYLTWFPAILLGPYAAAAPPAETAWRVYLVTLIAAWAVAATWLLRTLREAGRTVPERRPAVGASAAPPS